MKLSTQSPNALPIYIQVSEILIRDIAAGHLIDGQRLTPEREMAKSFGISVGTLRKSLTYLEDKGVLERIQGSGNYVRARGDIDSVYAMFRLELLRGGGLPRAEILDIQKLEKPIDLPEFGISTHASRIRRLRYINDTIVAVEEIWLDISVGIVDPKSLSDSLYHYYRHQLGFVISQAKDRVGVAPVPDWSPAEFTKPPHTPVGYIERHSWADRSEPIEFSRTWFDQDKALYTQKLK